MVTWHHLLWGAGMPQWWEHSPPTDVARDRFSNSTQYVGWVCCWFSSLLREVFLRILRFSPLLKNQHFQILIRSRIQWTNNHYVDVPLQIPILFYSILTMKLFPAKCYEQATLRKLWRQTVNSSLLPAKCWPLLHVIRACSWTLPDVVAGACFKICFCFVSLDYISRHYSLMMLSNAT